MNKVSSIIVAWYITWRLRKFKFCIVNSEDDKDEVYKLRYKVYCEELGFLEKSKYPNERETDEYDKYSITFVAKINNKVVGTLRLIEHHGIGIPSEKYVDIWNVIPQKSKYGEVSRFVVDRHFRKSFVSIGLIREVVSYAINNKYDYLVITNSLIHEKRYHKLGFYRFSKPYVYPGVNDKYLAITMINNIHSSKLALPKTQPVFYELLRMTSNTNELD